jgi:Tfp pilus assembly protein PilF
VVYFNRGVVHRLAGDHRRALADLNEAVRLDPKYAIAYLQRALTHQALNDQARAQADFQTAARLDPKLAKK